MEEECSRIVLWRSPIQTLYYFTLQLLTELVNLLSLLLNHTLFLVILLGWVGMLAVVVQLDGPHQEYLTLIQGQVWWCLYWVGLGVLSSVGLGTGLHTFLLYLGPHIASVTMAAWECKSTDFPAPPYPSEIQCPVDSAPVVMSLWLIMSKIRLESFMWGAGTALGELPPYFMARAARLSGGSIDDDDLKELEEISDKSDLTIWQKLKLGMHSLVQKAGFVGILLCASIPNPLFDLAGITCGHFLVPFTTFFGATLIGKAVIKMHIQMLFVILIFTKHHLEAMVSLVASIPYLGPIIHSPFNEYMEKQKLKLHSRGEEGGSGGSGSMISALYEKLVILMIGYFVLSIVNSMAQQKFREVRNGKVEKADKAQ